MPYQFLFFDLDHTLMDFDASEEVALNQLLQEEGVKDVEGFKAYYRPMNQAMWVDLEAGRIDKKTLVTTRFSKAFAHFGIEKDGSELAKKYEMLLAQQGHLYPGVLELLQKLKGAGYKLFAATNGITAIQKGRLAHSGLDQVFDQVFISDELGAQKPDPEFFARAASLIPDFDKTTALMIGDKLAADIKGGQSFGIDTVWYNPHGKETRGIEPTFTVSNYKEIKQLLLK